MSHEIKIKRQINLHGTRKGTISIGELSEPYGANSESVVTIAVSLSGKEVDWKVHIPYQNLDEVISALNEIKK